MSARAETLDCLVIGGGPAGLLAAIYFGRYRRHVQVIDAGESRAAKIPLSHNYPGFFGIAGSELLERLRAQAQKYRVPLMEGQVTSLRKEGDLFVASGPDFEMQAKFVLLTTGLVDHCPQVDGAPPDCPIDAIRFCPICDGYEATDRRVGVLGDLATGAKKALFLRTYTKHVSLFAVGEASGNGDTRRALANAKVTVLDKPRQIKLTAAGKVCIVTESGANHELDAIYPAFGCAARSDLATQLGALCADTGNLVVDDHQRTTVPGLYAAGDVVTDLHQLSVAFGHAAVAATSIHNQLPANYY
jgi:thioredoxin reductase (NADPH)